MTRRGRERGQRGQVSDLKIQAELRRVGVGISVCVRATTETETPNFSLCLGLPPLAPEQIKIGGSPKVIKPELQVSDR